MILVLFRRVDKPRIVQILAPIVHYMHCYYQLHCTTPTAYRFLFKPKTFNSFHFPRSLVRGAPFQLSSNGSFQQVQLRPLPLLPLHLHLLPLVHKCQKLCHTLLHLVTALHATLHLFLLLLLSACRCGFGVKRWRLELLGPGQSQSQGERRERSRSCRWGSKCCRKC